MCEIGKNAFPTTLAHTVVKNLLDSARTAGEGRCGQGDDQRDDSSIGGACRNAVDTGYCRAVLQVRRALALHPSANPDLTADPERQFARAE